MNLDYKQAGVNIAAGEQAVSAIKDLVASTHDDNVLTGLGGFGAEYALGGLLTDFEDPILVSGTDGVGTKLKLAIDLKRHDTIGIDLVAMCANDILAQGALPLFFLDYLGVGQLDAVVVKQIIEGITVGCRESHLSLIGGEMAEMPGIYQGADYDLSGFATGIVSRTKRLSAERVAAGDILVGLPSSGVHSNGFSLVRTIVESAGLDINKTYPDFQQPLGEVLLTPTRLYCSDVYPLMADGLIQAAAHITGGGLADNLKRSVPEKLTATIRNGACQPPAIFKFLQKAGQISDSEMRQVFNMGIGMVLVVRASDVDKVMARLPKDSLIIGEMMKRGDAAVEYN